MIIGIIHHNSTKKFLPLLLNSLKGVKYKVFIINNKEGYELGALDKLIKKFPKENDFFLLHETTVIKDQEIFDIAAEFDGTFTMSGGFMCFMAKYRREILEKVGIPIPKDRNVAIYYEYFWNIIYMNIEDRIALCDQPLRDTASFEIKFGRRNMIIENKYIKKWKSNWQGLNIKKPSPENYL